MPAFDTQPFVVGPPLAQRRVAIVSSAALIRRGDKPFPFGSAECRFLPASMPASDILMSHVSINFDRAGFQRDLNVVYPIDRLRELAAEGVIGGVAETHFHRHGLDRSRRHDGDSGPDRRAIATRTDRFSPAQPCLTPLHARRVRAGPHAGRTRLLDRGDRLGAGSGGEDTAAAGAVDHLSARPAARRTGGSGVPAPRVMAALGLLERTDGPVILEDFTEDPPGWRDTPGWRAPRCRSR